MICYRLQRREWPRKEDAFGGEGGLYVAGRWNPQGMRMVYTASSISLACLETIVHAPSAKRVLEFLLLFRINVPQEQVWTPESLPEDWNSVPPSESTRALGREWCESMKSAAMVVPSAVIPWETNILLNPRHPAFSLDWVSAPEDFHFDPRLWSAI